MHACTHGRCCRRQARPAQSKSRKHTQTAGQDLVRRGRHPALQRTRKTKQPPLSNGRPDKGGPRRRVSSRMSLPPPNGRLGEAKRWPALKRNERPYNRRRGPRPNRREAPPPLRRTAPTILHTARNGAVHTGGANCKGLSPPHCQRRPARLGEAPDQQRAASRAQKARPREEAR